MKKLILFPFIVALFFTCKKKESSNSNTTEPVSQAPKIDTFYTFHPIDRALRPYYAFTDDSYWVYKDYSDNSIDSLFLSNYQTSSYKTSSLKSNILKIDEFEIVTYTLISTTNVYYCKRCQNFNFYIKGTEIRIDYKWQAVLMDEGNPLTIASIDKFIFKDTIKLHDGRIIDKVRFLSYSFTFFDPVRKGVNSIPISNSYWVPNYGMIKCKELISQNDWELIRSNVKLR